MAAQQQRFLGKVVIITGSSSGIGQDAAVEFAKEGASLVIHGQNPQTLDETEKLILNAGIPVERILKLRGSLENHETAERIVSETIGKFSKIDVLINNAASGKKPGAAAEDHLNLDALDFLYEVNFRSLIQLCLLALPHLKKTKGNVLNISSAGSIRAIPSALYYCALKAGLDHFTRGFAQLAAPDVRVNSLNPGPIVTPIFEKSGLPAEQLDGFAKMTLLGRFGQTSEMSPAIKFLCSDEASYITGAILLADGGLVLKT